MYGAVIHEKNVVIIQLDTQSLYQSSKIAGKVFWFKAVAEDHIRQHPRFVNSQNQGIVFTLADISQVGFLPGDAPTSSLSEIKIKARFVEVYYINLLCYAVCN